MQEPKVIYIETTNLCNAKCIMCPHEKLTRKLGFMENKIFTKVVQDCKSQKIENKQIFLHKEGEPLLDNEIFEKIEYLKKEIGVKNEIGLNTNAMLLTPEKSKQLIQSGLDTVYFSLDGVEKEAYENIRKNLDYDVVVSNIKKFFELKKELKSPIRVIMQMLTQRDDSEEEKLFRKIWESYPCEFYIKRMHSYLDGGHSSLLDKLENIQRKSCEDPFKIAVVYTNGEVGLCCWDYDNEYSIGNVLDHNLFKIFNNEKSKRMREAHLTLNCKSITPCNRCGRVFGKDKISEY